MTNASEAVEKRVPFPVKVRPSVVEKARNAVFWTEGLTMCDLVERSVLDAVAKLERKRGEKFGAREGALPSTGRPPNRAPGPKRPRGRPPKEVK